MNDSLGTASEALSSFDFLGLTVVSFGAKNGALEAQA
jgi:hypothetical protein